MAETITDRLITHARKHGWTVTDDRATKVTAWFVRGEQYALLGTDITGTRGAHRIRRRQGPPRPPRTVLVRR